MASLFLAVTLAAVFLRLGAWQWHRGRDREAQWARFARGAVQVIDLDDRPVTDVPLYQRVRVSGELDGAHQFLLDNRILHGRAGFEVLTPLNRSTLPALIVDRGWVPFGGRRTRLPDVSLDPAGRVTLTGRTAALPSAGLAIGRAPPAPGAAWPKVTSYPRIEELAEALGKPLSARILLLDPGTPYGFEREWQPPGLGPMRHFGYALQWWMFAGLALAAWFILRRHRREVVR
ncbi:MAG: SURF1 family protein [Gammaproteobacteria bacterium]|nr:SURF1 family protein [Gammaproteobacteria bacterium]